MTKLPRIGIIGLGVMATRMLTNMTTYGGFGHTAGWDVDDTACRRATEAFPGLAIAGSAADVINSPDVDAIYIATPPLFHHEYAVATLDAGKPVLCEKPLGIDVEESRALVAHADATAVANCVNFPFAAAAAVMAMEQGMESGAIGSVEAVDIRLHFCKWPRDWQVPAAWLVDRADGGFVRETFSHYAYLTEKLFGPATLTRAITRYPDDGHSAETHALALMECDGIPVTFAGGTGGMDSSIADRIDYTVWGSKAAYRLYDWNRLRINTGDGWIEALEDIADPRQDGYRRQLVNFGDFLRGSPNTMPSFADALRVQELVEAILAS